MTVTFESTTLASPPVNTIVGSDTIGGIDYQRIKVAWGTTGSVTDASTTAGFPIQVTGQSSSLSVTPSSQWTVTTTPSSVISVNQGTSPWVTSIASSTAFLGSVAVTSGSLGVTSSTVVIGSVMPSSQWTVTTIPSSVITVNQGTSPWVTSVASSTAIVGSVYITTASLDALESISITSSTATIGAVVQGTSPWVTSVNSSTITIGAVAQVTSPWVTSVASSTAFLGSVAVTSGTVTLTSGTLALGTIGALEATGALYNTANGLSVTTTIASLTASATTTTSGNQIVAAGTGSIRVISMFLVAAGAVNLQFGSSAGAPITGITALSSNAGYVLPFNPAGWFQSASATGLYAYLTLPVQVGGSITYTTI